MELFVRKLHHGAPLTREDTAILAALPISVRTVEARVDFGTDLDAVRSLPIILEGWACRYRLLENGKRQIINLILPGDLCEPFGALPHFLDRSLASLTMAATGLCLVAVQAHAQTAAADRFLTKAIEGNLGEVAMGDLAIVRGATEKVKAYGEMLKADHAAANEKALQIAASANVTAPSEPSKEAKAAHARLSKLEGAAFDKAFAKAMVDDHKKDIASFTKALRLKDAPEVVGFANETLPHLRDHLRKAQALR